MKAYKAYGVPGHVTAETPRAAASLFFATFPKARKCDIIEGAYDGQFFCVTYGRASEGKWPYSVKAITKKTIETLREF